MRFVAVVGVMNVYINNCHEGKRNETELVGMGFGRDYNREAVEKIAVRTLVNLGRMGYADIMFFDYEMVTYVADKLEYVYFQGRFQACEDIEKIAVRTLVNLGRMGYADSMFFDYEMAAYVADELEYVYFQGLENCIQIADEVF